MIPLTFKDNDGNELLTAKVSVPGIFFTPPGKTVEDGEPITDRTFRKKFQDTEAVAQSAPKPPRIEDLAAKLDSLKAENDQLKKDVSDLKANAGKPSKP